MTALELIISLQELPPDTRIIIRGYEDGYNDILRLIPHTIIPHPHQKADYYGEFTDVPMVNEKVAGIKAIELYGENTKADK
jgi:hypothetical protein